jgi:hypothetical protein
MRHRARRARLSFSGDRGSADGGRYTVRNILRGASGWRRNRVQHNEYGGRKRRRGGARSRLMDDRGAHRAIVVCRLLIMEVGRCDEHQPRECEERAGRDKTAHCTASHRMARQSGKKRGRNESEAHRKCHRTTDAGRTAAPRPACVPSVEQRRCERFSVPDLALHS